MFNHFHILSPVKKAHRAALPAEVTAAQSLRLPTPVAQAAATAPTTGNDGCSGSRHKMAVYRIQSGLSVKLSHFHARQDSHLPHLTFRAGLRVVLMLSGSTQLRFRHTTVAINSQMPQHGLWLPVECAEPGSKLLLRGDTHQELVLFIDPDWLNDWCTALPSLPEWLRLTGQHLHFLRFTLTPTMTQLAKQIFALDDVLPLVRHTQLSTLVMQLWQAVIRQMMLETDRWPILRRNAQKQLNKLMILLHSGRADRWTLAQMAAHCCTNVTTLQRHFQQCHGISIWHYLRRVKLERAYHALQSGITVSTAAEIAGYQHIESFSKAFKLQYGCSPVKIRQLI